MSLLLLHLSDIHIAKHKSHVLARARAIVDATKNLDYDVNAAIVLITGDIAFSGQEDEYLAAISFIDEIRNALSSSLPAKPIFVCAAPGNHDCQFDDDDKIRSVLVDYIRQHGAQGVTADMLALCTSVQRHFFEFRDATQSTAPVAWNELPLGLAYCYHLSVDGKTIRILCLNTAWVSEKKEQQGALLFPSMSCDQNGDAHDLAITMFHHPYNWFESRNGAGFRRMVEQASHLVLTGHEHDPEQYMKHAHAGRSNIYLAGGVLSDRDNPHSSFFALVVDTVARQYKSFQFGFDGSLYVLDSEASPADVKWDAYPATAPGTSRTFGLSNFMEQFLEEPGISLTHRSRSSIKLSEIFVPPDLREMHLEVEERGELVKGQQLPGLLQDTPYLLIIGDDQSGKTCLGKHFFRLRVALGDVPIWLEGSESVPTDAAKLDKYLEEAFSNQYSPEALNSYRQLEKGRRVIILDNYHLAAKNAKARQLMLSLLLKRVGRIVLLAHDLTVTLRDLADPAGLAGGTVSFSYYRIQALGYARRNELVERWLALDEGADNGDPEYLHNLVTITNTLDTLIGRNYIPPYPVYVLSVLQASEAVTPVDTRASTHGYFYELFIRIALSQGATSADYDIIASYLAHLAFKAFDRKTDRFDDNTFMGIHRDFEKEFDIARAPDRLLQDLIEKRILVRSPGGYIAFKYKFAYYYFVALYMRDRITMQDIRDHISYMARHLYVEAYANILLFLSHLSKDRFIVDEMISCADMLYNQVKPATLEADVDFLSELEELSKSIVLEDRNPQEERRKMLEQKDLVLDATRISDESSAKEAPIEEGTPDDAALASLNASLKTLEILGQILRNFPGSLDGDTKLRIAKTCYGLGRRTLATWLDIIRNGSKELMQLFGQHIRSENPGVTQEEVEKRAVKNATGLAWLVAYGLLRKLAISVGSKEVASGSTYDKLLAEDPVAAVQLVDAMIAVDHSMPMPIDKIITVNSYLHDRWFSRTMLAHCVVRHCQLYGVEYREKQRLAQALGIDHKKVVGGDASRRLTS